MNIEQRIKRQIIKDAVEGWGITAPSDISVENVDAVYSELKGDDAICEARHEFRDSGMDTGIECDWSRHYESKSVATKLDDGTWVGWTYWFGGGKHSEPAAIDWMDSAYELSVTEEEKMVTVRTFTKA